MRGRAHEKTGRPPSRGTRRPDRARRERSRRARIRPDAAEAARRILARLERHYPDARIELDYETPLQLLVATILSAQCTDQRVNQVTRTLFQKYRTAADFARADPAVLMAEIRPTGFYRNKARAIIGCCQRLVAEHGGEVPGTMEALTALPGVWRKTASVVLGNAFGKPALAVDTHVARVANRLGLTATDDPDRIEQDLCGLIPPAHWAQATHLFIFHGRYTCKALRPLCDRCPVYEDCLWPGKPKRQAPGPALRPATRAVRG
jgi:endonuclease-3